MARGKFGAHPETVGAVWNMAFFLQEKRGRYAEALPLLRRAAAGAAAHPDDANCRTILGHAPQSIHDCQMKVMKWKVR